MKREDKYEENFSSIILNSLRENIAVLDKEGTVVFINNLWREFDEDTGGSIVQHIKLGMNFMELYRRYEDTPHIAYDILNGIKNIIEGKTREFTFEYARPSKGEHRNFLFRVNKSKESDEYTIVSHMDITDRKKMEIAFREIKERTRLLFNETSTMLLVIDPSDGKVVEGNSASCRFYGYSNDEILEKKIFDITTEPEELVKEKMQRAIMKKSIRFECQHRLKNGTIKDVEVYSSPIKYNNTTYLFSIIHDITDKKVAESLLKKSVKRAAAIQRESLDIEFPLEGKATLTSLYMPANELSGDFFRMIKLNEGEVLGILGDVAGKGIEAALSVNGVKMMFGDGAFIHRNPLELLGYLNRKVSRHMEDEYVAACCFKFDFKRKEAVIAGAGISEFLFQKKGSKPERLIVKGPFLGMFEGNEFEKYTVPFDSGDRFYFYTDGLENLFDPIDFSEKIHQLAEVDNLKYFVEGELSKEFPLKDDCTLLSIKIL